MREYARSHLSGRFLEVRFEDILENPNKVLGIVTGWLGMEAPGNKLENEVDPQRAAKPKAKYTYPKEVQQEVAQILAPLRRKLGYL